MPDHRRELNGWKEIATYLGKGVRTVQSYEQHGLPVRRMGEGDKSPVFAYTDELDTWKARYVSSPQTERPVPPSRSRSLSYVFGGILLASLGAAAALMILPTGPAHRLRVENQDLIALDKSDKELWRYTFPSPPQEAYYAQPGSFRRSTRLVDLNGDGEVEALFNFRPVDARSVGTTLFCFSQNGRVGWVFKPGRSVSDRQQTYSPVFFISGILTMRVPGKNEHMVIVSANHSFSYPNQVVALTSRGQVLGEYWHSGHLLEMALADLDADGKEELLLAGANNGFQQATLVVVDPLSLSGAAAVPEGDIHEVQGFKAAQEKDVLLFPRTCMNRKFEEFNHIYQLAVTATSVEVSVSDNVVNQGRNIIYQLDRRLNLTGLTVSDLLRNRHRELEQTGALNHQGFGDAEFEGLKQIKYFRR